MPAPLNREEYIPEFNKKLCATRKYHRYDVLSDSALALVEQCAECGDKQYYSKAGNKIHNARWMKNHEVDLLQPSDPRFHEIYGEPRIPKLRPS